MRAGISQHEALSRWFCCESRGHGDHVRHGTTAEEEDPGETTAARFYACSGWVYSERVYSSRHRPFPDAGSACGLSNRHPGSAFVASSHAVISPRAGASASGNAVSLGSSRLGSFC